MFSLFLRNLFFTILQPGLVAGLFPYWVLGDNRNFVVSRHLQWFQYAAILIFSIGFVMLFDCIIRFTIEGKGTISPADPTKKLVVRGLYKYSRNPMYFGVLLILIGQSLFFESKNLWFYSAFIFFAFYLFVLLIEEPRLKRDFGEPYSQYRKKVRRWI